tara:strand:- start:13 stop:855 length:843 start_codon:yes stop_codon:yes gene_type:complete
MALVAEITKIITVADSSSSLNNKYFLINAVNTDTTVNVGYKTVQYYVWMNVGSAGSDPSISGATGVEVTFAADASAPTVATAVKNKLDAITGFSASVGVGAGNDTTITVTNANKGAVTDASDNNTGFTISTTTQGTGQLTGNIKYPEDQVLYFIRGDHLSLVTTYSSSAETRTARKAYQAIDHNMVNGMLIHYYGNPKRVTAITDTPDVDNLFHSAIVDYVKKCLYMDRAGSTGDANRSQVAMGMMAQHERKFNNAIKKYGNRKRSKTGGTRAIVPANFT